MSFDEKIQKAKRIPIIPLYIGELHNANGLLKGICPFHKEDTPSFVIYPATNSFNCFGCGKGGDVITFMRLLEDLSFSEAVKKLLK